jgi:hypothetical protein
MARRVPDCTTRLEHAIVLGGAIGHVGQAPAGEQVANAGTQRLLGAEPGAGRALFDVARQLGQELQHGGRDGPVGRAGRGLDQRHDDVGGHDLRGLEEPAAAAILVAAHVHEALEGPGLEGTNELGELALQGDGLGPPASLTGLRQVGQGRDDALVPPRFLLLVVDRLGDILGIGLGGEVVAEVFTE